MEKPFNIVDLFIHTAEEYPNKTAIWDKNGDKITFSELARHVRQTANYFKRKGILKGDRVLLFVPMGIDLYRNVLALFYLGATVVFVDQWSKIDRLDTCCQIADCKAFVGSWKAHVLRFFSKGIRQIPIKLGLSYSGVGNDQMCQTLLEDAALITFTTGSTGTPKAALRTHGFLYEQFKALEEEIKAKPSDVDMSVLPIVLLINLAVGSTSVIADFNPSKPTKIQRKRIVRQLLDHRVTRLVASPYFIKYIAEHVSEHKIPLPELNDIFTGGAPVFLKEAKLYNKAFPAKNVRILYGSTEAEPISSIAVDELASETSPFNLKSGIPVGAIFHKTQVKIIPITNKPLFGISLEAFERMQQPEGVWGEIIVAGPHVLSQYYKNEHALRVNKILIDGVYWHRTGDSGYIRDGRLFLTGRCNTLIPQGEDWLSTFVFENFVQSINGVEMGTILSDGDNIRAFIELTKETKSTKEQVLAALQQLPFKITTVKFQRLPRDPRHHAKIEYSKLT
ncbi:AMP-binding protein [Sphingobacterium gobiense]|uniref:AMP-dependent synthetase n=1 Tax=Sphingobacterium gobiense TaxID=1382456 RepID=A0A2S9JR56_9SPHI|nr:AMP-binding protein [Sphingobacterium gobiense]PRD55776.1 AMP-dependent synthetase [Sphingobacterium gobiense]